LPAPRLVPPVKTVPSADISFASYRLEWSAVPGADAGYVLEEATRDDFLDTQQAYSGRETSVTIDDQPEGIFYYRVRALGTVAASAWSRPIQVRIDPAEPAELLPESEFDDAELTRLHRATLALCAARGDIFAVLALPRHHREDAALTHCDRLNKTTEGRTLSFGALYHPWLVGRAGELTGEPRAMPPDGAVCGQIAQRTLVSGAWFAPANDPLADVLALTPTLAPARWLDLQEAGVNVVRHEPRGFLLLAANTLEHDEELRPITVRRLLILLRRLALRRGARYVFEPNDAAFRRLVQRGFEATLDDLFVRGAFAGDTPESAYQVDTGPGLNTRQSVDAGRFIVELRVAPSRPLTFLTIRLVQTSDRALVVLER
jgi:phage tail sheath protein FI